MNSSIIQEEPTSDPNEIQTLMANAFCFSLVLLSTLFLLKLDVMCISCCLGGRHRTEEDS
ncbi:unnamed protein product [Brassica oleracea]